MKYKLKTNQKWRKNINKFFAAACLPIIFIMFSGFAKADGERNNLYIVTPSWKGQTNKDGTGLYFDIVRAVYIMAGIKVKYDFVPWKRAQRILAKKQADAMLGAWQDDAERQGQLIPDYPLCMEYTGAIFKKQNILKWEGLRSLEKKKAVWLRGYDYQTIPQFAELKLNWTEVDEYRHIWLMLHKERVDVYIDALIDITRYIADNKIDMTLYQMEVLWKENIYMAFSNTEKSKRFIKIFNRRIIELVNSGELKKIYQKWNMRYSPDSWRD